MSHKTSLRALIFFLGLFVVIGNCSAEQHGVASMYWQPQKLAGGGWYNPNGVSVAHKTLPLGTVVRITNKRNGAYVDAPVNDRGPYVKGRIVDLSLGAAKAISFSKKQGVIPVKVEVVKRKGE